MSRSVRNNVDYFPFICKEGKTMYYIESTYDNDGFAAWMKILRELAVTDFHYLTLNNQREWMYLSAKCKVPIGVLEAVINDLVDLEEFDREMWESYNVIWSQKFIDNIQDAYRKRSNECMTKERLIETLGRSKPPKLRSNENKDDSSDQNSGKNPQSIVDNSKVEKKKEKNKGEIKNFTKRDFRKALKAFGANDQHIDDWLKAREKKKAVYSKTALDRILNECKKFKFPVAMAIEIAAQKSWSGFKYEWLDDEEKARGKPKKATQKPKGPPTEEEQQLLLVQHNKDQINSLYSTYKFTGSLGNSWQWMPAFLKSQGIDVEDSEEGLKAYFDAIKKSSQQRKG